MLRACNVRVDIPMIDTAYTFPGGLFPAQWLVGSRADGRHESRQEKCLRYFHTTCQCLPYSLWNPLRSHEGGAKITLTNASTKPFTRGLEQLNFYVDTAARISKNYQCFNTNYSNPNVGSISIKKCVGRLQTLSTCKDRLADHVTTAGCNYRIEGKQVYSYHQHNVHRHLMYCNRRSSLLQFMVALVENIIENQLFECRPMIESECPTINDILESFGINYGRIMREMNHRSSTLLSVIFPVREKLSFFAYCLAFLLQSCGFSSESIHKWPRQYLENEESYDPDCLIEIRHDRMLRNSSRNHLDHFGNLTEEGKKFILFKKARQLVGEEKMNEYVSSYQALASRAARKHLREQFLLELNELYDNLVADATHFMHERFNFEMPHNKRALKQKLHDSEQISHLFAQYCPVKVRVRVRVIRGFPGVQLPLFWDTPAPSFLYNC